MKSKIVAWLLVGLVGLFFGLFILPQEIKIIRWMEVDASEAKAWHAISSISEWDHWDPWGNKAQGEQRVWGKGGVLKITKVEPEKLRVTYAIDQQDGGGLLYVDPKPENTGVWVKWEHTYRCGYDPFQRVSHWLARGEFALELDGGLKKLKLFLEDDKAQGDSL